MSDLATKKPRGGKRFSADNQPSNRRGKDRFKLLVEALERRGDSLETFYDKVVEMAMTDRADGAAMQSAMIRELLVRCHPIPKQTAPMITFEYPEAGTPVEKVDAIIKGVALGEIPSDIGKQIVDIVKVGIDVQEVTELMERVAKLEKMLSGGGVNVQSADE